MCEKIKLLCIKCREHKEFNVPPPHAIGCTAFTCDCGYEESYSTWVSDHINEVNGAFLFSDKKVNELNAILDDRDERIAELEDHNADPFTMDHAVSIVNASIIGPDCEIGDELIAILTKSYTKILGAQDATT